MDPISHNGGPSHDPRRELEASTRALAAADDWYVQQAMAGVQWARVGFLQRLTRSPR
jgi:hypothetical protein